MLHHLGRGWSVIDTVSEESEIALCLRKIPGSQQTVVLRLWHGTIQVDTLTREGTSHRVNRIAVQPNVCI